MVPLLNYLCHFKILIQLNYIIVCRIWIVAACIYDVFLLYLFRGRRLSLIGRRDLERIASQLKGRN